MQNITVFKNDQSGVSPVIGVILMVAVTVIIAAVIGSTALGLGDSVSETPPQAQFEVEQDVRDIDTNGGTLSDAHLLRLTHTSGENIDPDEIKVTVNGYPAYGVVFKESGSSDLIKNPEYYGSGQYEAIVRPFDNYDLISAGDEFTLLFYGDDVNQWINNNEPLSEGKLSVPFNSNHFLYQTVDGGEYRSQDDYRNDLRFEGGDTLRIIWESGDSSQMLFEDEVGDF